MEKFNNLFRFSKKEVSRLFEHATLKSKWRGLRLLQAPLDCLDQLKLTEIQGKTQRSEVNKPAQSLGRLLIITPSHSGKANKRNLFRRRVKNIFYSNKLYLNPVISILIAGRNATDLDFDHIQKFIIKNLAPDQDQS